MITYKYREDSVVKYMTDTAIDHEVWDILSVQFTHTHTKKKTELTPDVSGIVGFTNLDGWSSSQRLHALNCKGT